MSLVLIIVAAVLLVPTVAMYLAFCAAAGAAWRGEGPSRHETQEWLERRRENRRLMKFLREWTGGRDGSL